MLLRLLACSAAFALLAAAPAAARPKRPDLVVRLLARPPAQLNPGAKLEVRVRVDNVGRGRAPRSLVTLHLSRDARLGRGDVRLPGSFRARALAGARPSAATGTLGTTVPARAAPGRYRLLACVDAGDALSEGNERNNCAAAPVLLVVPPPLEEVAAPAFAAPPPTFAAPPAGTQTVAGRVSY